LSLNESTMTRPQVLQHLTGKLEPIIDSSKLALWSQFYINLQGKPFSFKGHAYLRELYADPQPRVVIRKTAQMGGGTYALARSLYTALSRDARCLYYLPTDAEAALFSNNRLATWLENSPQLGKWIRRQGDIWRVGGGRILLRGLFAEMRARAIDADMIVLDELGMLSPARRTQALDRLLHSSLGYVLELSTPKLPGTGIDARFAETDMRYWMIKCPGCSWEEPLEHGFPACVGRTGSAVRLVCPRCGHGLDAQAGR
jgi:phage terminase large subunit GpA-like protein